MHLGDDGENANEDVRIAKQQWDDAYCAVVEHTLGYLMGRSEEQMRLRHSRDAELRSSSREANGRCRRSGNNGRNR